MIGTVTRFLTQDIVILRRTVGYDDWGNPIETYTPEKTIKGRIRQLSTAERLSADREISATEYRLYTKELDILTTDRISLGGVEYDVTGINNVMTFDALNQVGLELRA